MHNIILGHMLYVGVHQAPRIYGHACAMQMMLSVEQQRVLSGAMIAPAPGILDRSAPLCGLQRLNIDAVDDVVVKRVGMMLSGWMEEGYS